MIQLAPINPDGLLDHQPGGGGDDLKNRPPTFLPVLGPDINRGPPDGPRAFTPFRIARPHFPLTLAGLINGLVGIQIAIALLKRGVSYLEIFFHEIGTLIKNMNLKKIFRMKE